MKLSQNFFSAWLNFTFSSGFQQAKYCFQSCFLVTIFPVVALLHFLHIDTHTKPTISPIALTKGQRSKRQLLNSLRWPINLINSNNNTKLPCYTLLRIATQLHSSFRNLPPLLFLWMLAPFGSIFQVRVQHLQVFLLRWLVKACEMITSI